MPVTLRGLGHRFAGGPWLFRHLDADLSPGRTYALTGPSGSGKSTLLSILAGWTRAAEGTCEIRVPGRTSWVFQNPHGSPRRSARDHVAWPLLARGITPRDADAQAADLLERVGLAALADREFRFLSGGEGQRLVLARGLAASPGLLLADEPTAQLDRVRAAEVNDVLTALRPEGTVVVVATHDEGTRAACTDAIDLSRHAPSVGPGSGDR